MSRLSANELRDALRAGLAKRLAPDGWRQVGDDGHRLVGFVCPVADDFVATIEVSQASSVPDSPPVVVTYMHAGVGYEPLRRLAPLLGMFDLDVQSVIVWPAGFAEYADDGDGEHGENEDEDQDDDDDEEHWGRRELRTLGEADQFAGELAVIARERAVAYAGRYAELDVLLARVAGPGSGSVCRAALLASAGRFEEARVSLGRLAPPAPGLAWMRKQQRAARQLERWIDSGGDPTLIPDEPPPPGFQHSPSPSLSSVWQQARATSAAVDVVRQAGAGKDRAKQRALLERELAKRGVSQSPLWLEHTLDHLHDSPSERREQLVTGLISAGKLGIKVLGGMRERRPLPDLSVPEWLTPPARAAWAVPLQRPERWVEVQVAQDSASWMDEAYQAIPRLIGSTGSLQAWLDWDSAEQRRLAVHIGERRVGTLDESDTADYRAVMEAAGERDEVPYTGARLTPRPSPVGYLLELRAPV